MSESPKNNTGVIELTLPSRLGYEKVAMNAAANVAKLMGFDEERVEDLKTAVAEACINAMEHGNKFDDALSVGVTLFMGTDSLEVRVVDRGSGAPVTKTAPDIDKKMGTKVHAAWACFSSRRWLTRPSG